MKNILVMAATALTLTACAGAGEKEADIIDKPDYKSETGVFDIEALEALGRVSFTSRPSTPWAAYRGCGFPPPQKKYCSTFHMKA